MSAVLSVLVKGGPVMVPLALCSILSLATILEIGTAVQLAIAVVIVAGFALRRRGRAMETVT